MGMCMMGNKDNFQEQSLQSKLTTEQLSNIKQEINQQFSAFTFKGVTKVLENRYEQDTNLSTLVQSPRTNHQFVASSQTKAMNLSSINNLEHHSFHISSENVQRQNNKRNSHHSDHAISEESSCEGFIIKTGISKSDIAIKLPEQQDDQDYKSQFSQIKPTPSRIRVLQKIYEETDNTLINQIQNHKHKLLILATLKCIEPIELESITFNDGSTYHGMWMNAKRHGQGRFTSSEGFIYQGSWDKNYMEGYGIYTFANGDVYEGDFQNNCAHGKGVYTYSNGSVYDGEWVEDKKDGKGKQIYGINQFYDGEWKNGYKHGRGHLQFADGSYCKGYFFQNYIHGVAEYYWKDQKIYKGQWSMNRMQGKGVMEWMDGRRYQGLYQNDKMEGKGVFYSPTEGLFKGIWKNGKRNGRGQLIDLRNNIVKGLWYEDRYIEPHLQKNCKFLANHTK